MNFSYVVKVIWDSQSRTVSYTHDFGEFILTSMPGNSGVAISHNVYVKLQYRGKGIGTLMHRDRLVIASENGYSYLLATVNDDNVSELAILKKHGWQRLSVFTYQDKKDGEIVGVWGKQL